MCSWRCWEVMEERGAWSRSQYGGLSPPECEEWEDLLQEGGKVSHLCEAVVCFFLKKEKKV